MNTTSKAGESNGSGSARTMEFIYQIKKPPFEIVGECFIKVESTVQASFALRYIDFTHFFYVLGPV